MRQATLKLKMYASNVNIMNNNLHMEKIILNILLSVLAGLALWYLLILGNMVLDIVQRKALEKEALALSSEIGDLELSYLSISKSVDLSLSASMGFKEIKPTFATRKSLGSLGNIKLARNEI